MIRGKAGDGAGAAQKLVAVAIDKNKASQYALKWAVANLLDRGQTVFLLHVDTTSLSPPTTPMRRQGQCIDSHGDGVAETYRLQLAAQNRDLFLPFRCFCKLKDINCKDLLIEDTDVTKAIAEYASNFAIENLAMGCSGHFPFVNSFPPPILTYRTLRKPNFFPNVHRRLKGSNVPNTVCRMAPNFCSVFVICKGKMSSFRSAVRSPPFVSPLRKMILNLPAPSLADENQKRKRQLKNEGFDSMESPMNKNARVANNVKEYAKMSPLNTNIPFASPARTSTG